MSLHAHIVWENSSYHVTCFSVVYCKRLFAFLADRGSNPAFVTAYTERSSMVSRESFGFITITWLILWKPTGQFVVLVAVSQLVTSKEQGMPSLVEQGMPSLGYLPFTWENRKIWLENQMVCAISFGKPQKSWAVFSPGHGLAVSPQENLR